MHDLLHDKLKPLPTDVETMTTARHTSKRPKSARTAHSARSSKPHTQRRQQTARRTQRPASASPGRTFTTTQLTAATASAQYRTQRPYSAGGGIVGRQSRYDGAALPRAVPVTSDYSPLPARRTLGFSTETEVHIIDDHDDQGHEIDDGDYDVMTPRTGEDNVTGQQQVLVESERQPQVEPYRPKPFTELVKVQRPEVTRRERDRK